MPKVTRLLQLRDFRMILAIHETGQLALAAEQMSMTQPAASRLLSEIERSLGSPVFRRHPKGMTATAVGEILARNARNLLNGVDQTLRDVDAVASGRGGSARVGTVTGAAVALIVPAVHQLKKLAVGTDIHVEVGPSDSLIAGLLRGDYDFVLSRVPPGTDVRQFSILRGRVEVTRFVVRKEHPLAAGRNLGLADLAGYEWVIQASPTPMRQAVEDAFTGRGITLPAEVVNTSSLLVTLAYLISSDAIAPISKEGAEVLGRDGLDAKLATLDLREPIIIPPYNLIMRRDQIVGPLAMRLRDLVAAALARADSGRQASASSSRPAAAASSE
jgi:DNA-binding transcriptional LysR family regulator